MANVKNILKVADAIEARANSRLGFNMADWVTPRGHLTDHSGNECGTVACIAGWTCEVLTGSADNVYNLDYVQLGDLLGIGVDTAHGLFVPYVPGLTLSEIRDTQAVAVLRHLAATGEVDWSITA